MNMAYDVIIVGLGAMGSAAAYHLSQRSQSVLGLDRFTPPHTFGSSHSETRIIREAYAEDPSYVPIVKRARVLWEELEEQSGKKLLTQTGGLMIGRPDGGLVIGAETSAKKHNLPYERIDAQEITRRFPVLRAPDDMIAIWDPRAGVVYPEACIDAHMGLARKNEADLRFDEPVKSWAVDGEGVVVTSSQGKYRADRLILSAGAWIGDLLQDIKPPLTIERQVLFWFEAASNAEAFAPERCPIYVWDYEGDNHFYGLPDFGTGVKVARMHQGELTEADSIGREVSADDVEPIRALLQRFMPDANGRQLAAEVCMFTNTPDLHFVLDRHPIHSQVLISSPCSGHGFKFASAIGEILADLVTRGNSDFDLGLFRIDRFQ